MLTALYVGAGLAMLGVAALPPLPVCCVLLFLGMGLLGMGNGSVFQLVPQRFPREIGVLTGIVGAAGGIGGFFLPNLLGGLKQLDRAATCRRLRGFRGGRLRPAPPSWPSSAGPGKAPSSAAAAWPPIRPPSSRRCWPKPRHRAELPVPAFVSTGARKPAAERIALSERRARWLVHRSHTSGPVLRSRGRVLFVEPSFSVEILDASYPSLKAIAQELRGTFRQQEVILKSYDTGIAEHVRPELVRLRLE